MQARTHKLADVASVFNGKTPSRKEQRTKGFPVLKIKDVNEDGQFVGGFDSFVDEEFAEQFSDKFVRVGDTLVLNAAHSASYVGSKVYFAEPAVVGSLPTGEWLLIRPDAHKAVPEYVHYWVQSEPTGRRITDLVKGIHLYPKDVARLRISLPPLPEQKRIAAILAKADRLRRLRCTALYLSDTYLQSVFLEMFGDPVSNPRGWETDLLGNLGSGQNAIVDGPFGASVNTKVDYVRDGEIPVIRTKNVRPFEFVEDDLKFIRREKFETIKRSRVVPGDIILTKVGTVGNVCIFPDHFEEAVLSTTGSCKITPDTRKIDRVFLAHHLHVMRTHMNQVASEGVQAFLNMKTIKAFQITLPPASLQQEFAHIVHRFERLRAQQREAQRQAEHLFQTLLHRAFRGELEDPKGLGDP